jgi:hypothetical protein
MNNRMTSNEGTNRQERSVIAVMGRSFNTGLRAELPVSRIDYRGDDALLVKLEARQDEDALLAFV